MVFLQEVNFSLSLIYTVLYVRFPNHCQGTCKSGLDSRVVSESEQAEGLQQNGEVKPESSPPGLRTCFRSTACMLRDGTPETTTGGCGCLLSQECSQILASSVISALVVLVSTFRPHSSLCRAVAVTGS